VPKATINLRVFSKVDTVNEAKAIFELINPANTEKNVQLKVCLFISQLSFAVFFFGEFFSGLFLMKFLMIFIKAESKAAMITWVNKIKQVQDVQKGKKKGKKEQKGGKKAKEKEQVKKGKKEQRKEKRRREEGEGEGEG
jgi:hypothetical protein